MPDLPDVTQLFIANTAPYIASIREAAQAAKDFADANLYALGTLQLLDATMAGTAGSALALESAEHDLASAMADKSAEVYYQGQRLDDLRTVMGMVYAAALALASGEADLGRQLAITAGFSNLAARATGQLGLMSASTARALDVQQAALGGVSRDLVLASGAAGNFGQAEHDLIMVMLEKTGAAARQGSQLNTLAADMGYAYLATQLLISAESNLARQLALTAGVTDVAIRAMGALGTQAAFAALGLQAQERALGGTGKELMLASQAAGGLGRAEYELIAVMAEKTGAASRQGAELNDLSGQMGRTAVAAGVLDASERRAALSAAVAATAAGGFGRAAAAAAGATTATAAAGGRIAQFWAQWGAVVHWVVMGTLEIAATAIPAMVAFGAAAGAMASTFIHIQDQMTALRVATGSWTGALANSVGPLRAVAQAGYNLRQAVAPDAYIIFGAVINSLVGHVGAFSRIAQQAANVLAAFATKMSASLAGPMGAQLTGFFKNSVEFMTQWGQVLGNLGHIFVNVMSAFWGTSHVLLQGFIQILQVLEAITQNHVVAWFIGLMSAMSFVYRWVILLRNAFAWMGGPAAFAGIRAAITWVRELGATFVILAEEIGTADAALAILESLMPILVGIFFIATAAAAVYETVTHRLTDATSNLIGSINKMPPTLNNISSNMGRLGGDLTAIEHKFVGVNQAVAQSYTHMGRFGTAVDTANRPVAQMGADVAKVVAEYKKLAGEGVNLITGLVQAGQRAGAVGAAMDAMGIQTAIADSKIQQFNQAIDQYLGLLTGATSGNANFITSMANIGTVSATTRNNLGTNTTQLSLSASQFGAALKNMGTVGAAAWQNLDQVITGSAAPLMDTFRQMQVVGALSSQQVAKGALDMAVQFAHFAGTGRVARSTILGFLAAQGLTFPSFAKFEQAARAAHASQRDLNRMVDAGTVAMSHLSQMAKNAATAMNPLVAQAIDQTALSASGFNKNLAKLQTDMLNTHTPASVMNADMAAVQASYQESLKLAVSSGQGIRSQSGQTASKTHADSQTMGQAWGQAKLKQLNLQAQVQNSSGSIKSASASVAGSVQSAMGVMGAAFQHAQLKAQYLQSFIDNMHGKTINVNTVFTTTGNPSPGGGGATHGMHGLTVGFQGGGMVTGSPGIDSIHAMLSLGEAVLNARAVSAIGGPMAVHTLNNQPSQAVLTSGGGGAGGHVMSLNQKVDVKLDGSRIASAWRQDLLVYNRRNNTANTQLRAR